MLRTGPAFYIRTEGGEKIQLCTVDANGQETAYPETTAAELLLRRSELNFIPLRNEVARLWQEYPLVGYDRTQKKAELARLAEEVRAGSEMLRELDPLGYFYVVEQLNRYQPQLDAALYSEDMDLMEAGATLINILEEPAWSQIPLRNMFEIAFDGMERATQRERYELLTRTYAGVRPPVVDRYYPVRRIPVSNGDIPPRRSAGVSRRDAGRSAPPSVLPVLRTKKAADRPLRMLLGLFHSADHAAGAVL